MSKGLKILEIIAVKNQLDSIKVQLDNIKIFLNFKGFDIEWTKEVNGVINLLSHLSGIMMEKIDKTIMR